MNENDDPDYDADDEDKEDEAKKNKSEMFSVSGAKKPAETTSKDSMLSLFGGGGLPAGVKTIASSDTKNQYAVIAKKEDRELAMCCSLLVVKGETNYLALKLRLLELHDGSVTGGVFGLPVLESKSYQTPDGEVPFLRLTPLLIPLLASPSSPSELCNYLVNQEVGAIVGEAIKTLVAKSGGEMLVSEEVLYELVTVDANNLPNQPKGLFSGAKLLEALKLKDAPEKE